MRALLLAVVLALSGCLEGEGFAGLFSNDEATAKQALDDAEKVAAAWDEGARLQSAFAFESARSEFSFGNGTGPDPEIGNGKAVAWAFEFVAGDRKLHLVVAANGTVVEREEQADRDQEALPEWSVDSDDAVEAVRKDPRSGSAFDDAAAIGLALGDDGNGTGPVWALFTFYPSGLTAIVDAQTGEVRTIQTWDFEIPDWSSTWSGSWGMGAGKPKTIYEDEREGTLVAAAPEAVEPFPVANAVEIRISVAFDRRLPTDDLDVRLLDADGGEVEPSDTDASGGPTGRRTVEYVFQPNGSGQYALRLALDGTSAQATYEAAIRVLGYH